MKHEPRFLQWRKRGARIALVQPQVGQVRSREWQAVLFEQNESRPAFPSRNRLDQFLREWNPNHEPGLLLRDVDAGTALVFLDVGPTHFDQVAAALPSIRRQGDDAGQVWPATALGEPDLFIGPRLIAAGPAWGLGPRRDRIGQEVEHERPLLDRLERCLRFLLLCRSVGQAVEEGLHKRRPDDIDRIGSKRIRPLGKAKHIAIAAPRRLCQGVEFRARKIGPDDLGEAAALNVTLSLPHASPPLFSAPRRTRVPTFHSLPQGGAQPLSTAIGACRRSSAVAGIDPAAPNSRSCSRPRRCARRASQGLETEAGSFGLPRRLPRAFAAWTASLVRRAIVSRSCCATAARMWIVS